MLLSLEEVRDYTIIVYCILGAIVFLAAFFFTVAIGWTTWGVIRRVRSILKDNVQPATVNVREATANIKGTVSYISDTAIKPVVGAYGMAAGAKRFVGVVSRFRGGKNKDEG